MITHEQAVELYRCQSDALHFIEGYGFMKHPSFNYPLRFTPWDWQRYMIRLWQLQKSTILLKFRQAGASWCFAGYVNWLANFVPGIQIPLLSSNQEKAEELLSKVTFFYDHLPGWIRGKQVERSKSRLSIAMRYYDDISGQWTWGQSTIMSLTSTGTSGAGGSSRVAFIDEFALLAETGKRGMDEDAWASLAPTTLHGGQLIIGSTPRMGGAYQRIWLDTIAPLVNDGIIDDFMPPRQWNRAIARHYQDMTFVPIKAYHTMCYHDEGWIAQACRGMSQKKADEIREYFKDIKYDDAWLELQKKRLKLSEQKMLREFGLVFEVEGNPAFNTSDINACYYPRKDPWVQERLALSKQYFVGIDCAGGMAKTKEPDYNSLCVLNECGIQADAIHNRDSVGEWAGMTTKDPRTGKPVEIEGTVLEYIRRYLPCEVIVEKQHGVTVYNRVTPYLPDDAGMIINAMTGPMKSKMVKDLQLALEERAIFITDYYTKECLMRFTQVGPGRYEAAPGFKDDPVISLMWAMWLMNTHGFYNIEIGAASSGKRMVGVTPEGDMSLKEFAELTADEGPKSTYIPDTESPYTRMSRLYDSRGQGRKKRATKR